MEIVPGKAAIMIKRKFVRLLTKRLFIPQKKKSKLTTQIPAPKKNADGKLQFDRIPKTRFVPIEMQFVNMELMLSAVAPIRLVTAEEYTPSIPSTVATI